jgi:hypothetical protein
LCRAASVNSLLSSRAGRALGGEAVEPRGVGLHLLGGVAHALDRQRPYVPDRAADDGAFDVLAADQRNMLAVFCDIHVEQPAAVVVLLRRHRLEHLGAGGIVLAQSERVVGVDAPILLLAADGERQQLALGEVVESAHSGNSRIGPTSTRALV